MVDIPEISYLAEYIALGAAGVAAASSLVVAYYACKKIDKQRKQELQQRAERLYTVIDTILPSERKQVGHLLEGLRANPLRPSHLEGRW